MSGQRRATKAQKKVKTQRAKRQSEGRVCGVAEVQKKIKRQRAKV
jgi:hypothetical protein